MRGRIHFKRFRDDRELQVLEHVLEKDPDITVPVVEITEEGFYSEIYDEIDRNTPEIILQKIKLLIRLHKIDVYHHDLGDNNFLIKNGVVKIIDFGSAFLTTDAEWLEVLYETILRDDGEIITSKAEAFNWELIGFIDSF